MELESRCLNFIEPIMLKGQALINDKHPASSLIKSYTDSLSEQLELLKTLSHLLGIHLKKLVLLQTVRIQLKFNLSCSCLSNPGCFLAQFQADCREASKQLAFHKSNLRSLLNEPSQTSSEDELNENREKAETLLCYSICFSEQFLKSKQNRSIQALEELMLISRPLSLNRRGNLLLFSVQ